MTTQSFRFVQRKATSIDPSRYQSSSGAFVSLLDKNDHVTFLMSNVGGTIAQHLLVDSKYGGDKIALAVAQALNAHMEPGEAPDLTEITEDIVKVRARPEVHSRSNQFSTDLLILANLVTEMIPPNSWVALSVRRPSARESKQYLTWLSHRMGLAYPVHHSTRTDQVITSVTVGAQLEMSAVNLANYFMGNLPGFDLQTDSHVAESKSPLRWGLPAAAVIGLGVFVGLPAIPAEVLESAPGLVEAAKVPGGALAAVAAAAGVLGLTPKAPNEKSSALKSLGNGLRAPAARGSAPRKPTKEGTKTVARRDAEGNLHHDTVRIAEHPGDYPLHRECFMMDPSLFVSMLSPHATSTTGESAEKDRALPPALTEPRGPRVGVHASGESVYFDAASIQHGTSIFGTPGSGKSVLTRALFAWSCLEKRSPSGRPGAPGRNNTLIAFESKGRGGADMYLKWSEAVGVKTTLIDLLNPNTPSINFFDQTYGPVNAAKSFVAAMTYAWGEDAIGARSGPVLIQTLVAAQAVDAEVVQHHNLGSDGAELEEGKSPIYYAWRLLGGRNLDDAKQLFNSIKQRNEDANGQNAYYRVAVEQAGALFNGTDSQRRSLTESSKNKLDMLVELEAWWDPSRPSKTWAQVLNDHDSVVLNIGPSDLAEGFITDRDAPIVSAMLMNTLREAITQTCDNWEAQNRWVSLFADELSMIAGSSGEVVEWIRSKGRSFGVRPVFATQYPEQLSAQVRDSLMDYSTFVSFRQGNRNTAAAVAYQITTSSSEWADEDLTLMPNFHMVVRTQVNGRRQDAVMLANDFFEDRMDDFAHHQGYPDAPSSAPRPTSGLPVATAGDDRLEERNVQL